MQATYRVLRYIKDIHGQGVFFPRNSVFELKGYNDSDWGACLDTRKSVTGLCLFLGNSMILWKSKKHDIVARSTTEAEYKALSSAACEAVWLLHLLRDLGVHNLNRAILYCDSKSTISIAHNLVLHEKTKHIDIDFYFIRDYVNKGTIKTVHISTKGQVADVFTKPLGEAQFKYLVNKSAESYIYILLTVCYSNNKKWL